MLAHAPSPHERRPSAFAGGPISIARSSLSVASGLARAVAALEAEDSLRSAQEASPPSSRGFVCVGDCSASSCWMVVNLGLFNIIPVIIPVIVLVIIPVIIPMPAAGRKRAPTLRRA